MQRLISHVQSSQKRGYVLNLDPAVMSLPFTANIDIRDTVNYKNVMKEYHLGPNGGILTSLNLFATKFDEVISLCGVWWICWYSEAFLWHNPNVVKDPTALNVLFPPGY